MGGTRGPSWIFSISFLLFLLLLMLYPTTLQALGPGTNGTELAWRSNVTRIYPELKPFVYASSQYVHDHPNHTSLDGFERRTCTFLENVLLTHHLSQGPFLPCSTLNQTLVMLAKGTLLGTGQDQRPPNGLTDSLKVFYRHIISHLLFDIQKSNLTRQYDVYLIRQYLEKYIMTRPDIVSNLILPNYIRAGQVLPAGHVVPPHFANRSRAVQANYERALDTYIFTPMDRLLEQSTSTLKPFLGGATKPDRRLLPRVLRAASDTEYRVIQDKMVNEEEKTLAVALERRNFTISEKLGQGAFFEAFKLHANGREYTLKWSPCDHASNLPTRQGETAEEALEKKLVEFYMSDAIPDHPQLIHNLMYGVMSLENTTFSGSVSAKVKEKTFSGKKGIAFVYNFVETSLSDILLKAKEKAVQEKAQASDSGFLPSFLSRTQTSTKTPPSLRNRDKQWILRGIFEAVAHLHDHMVVHYDLNPKNVLVDMNSKAVKVADMGAAMVFNYPGHHDWERPMVDILGTPHFMPPEILLGREDMPYENDIWSLGIILAQVILERHPIMELDEAGDAYLSQYYGDPFAALISLMTVLDISYTEPYFKSLPYYFSFYLKFAHKESIDELPDTIRDILDNKHPFMDELKAKDPLAADLVSLLLQIRPEDRISVREALRHPYFTVPIHEVIRPPREVYRHAILSVMLMSCFIVLLLLFVIYLYKCCYMDPPRDPHHETG